VDLSIPSGNGRIIKKLWLQNDAGPILKSNKDAQRKLLLYISAYEIEDLLNYSPLRPVRIDASLPPIMKDAELVRLSIIDAKKA